MGAGSSLVFGGLLEGLGSGLAQEAKNRRDDALTKLKRQQELQDQAHKESEDAKKTQDEQTFKVGLLGLEQQFKQRQGETDEAYKERLAEIEHGYRTGEIQTRGSVESQQIAQKAQLDAQLARIRADLDKRNDAASKLLQQQIDQGETTVAGVSADGFAVLKRGDGSLITTHTKLEKPDKEGGDGGDPIAAARAARSGKAAPVKAAPVAAPAPAPAPPPAKAKLYNDVDAMVASRSLPAGKAIGQTLTAPDGTIFRWDGSHWR